MNDIEVIIVDDGSTDASLEICNSFSIKYSNFHTYSKINEGQGVARNFGLQKAQGQFVCYVDSDDWIEPSMCEDLVSVLNQTNADFANFGVEFITSEGKVVKKIDRFNVTELTGDNLFLNALIDKHVLSVSWNKIYRRSFLLENKILFPPFRVNEDLFYSRAVSYCAKKAIFISRIYYHALVRHGSISRKMSVQMFITSENLIKYEHDFFALRLEQEDFKRYFNAHVEKFFSYMLIQAAFRISDYEEYRYCFDVAARTGFYDVISLKDIFLLFGFKGWLIFFLCRHPLLLRILAKIASIIRVNTFIY